MTKINTGNPFEDQNRTMIAINVEYMGEREDLLEMAKNLVIKLKLEDLLPVLAATRLKGRFGIPGLVKKILLYTAREDFSVAREKKTLRTRYIQIDIPSIKQISYQKINKTRCKCTVVPITARGPVPYFFQRPNHQENT